MNKALLGAALALTATAANAADLGPPKAATAPIITAVEVEARSPFAGAYVGVHAGYSQLTDESDFAGWSGGGQLGFNVPMGGGVVAGLELDGSLSGANFSASDDAYAVKIGNDWIVSARGRIGYVIGNVMPYATAGIAWAKFSGRETDLEAETVASLGDTVRMWVIGGGVDYAIPATNLVAGVGLLHYFEDGIDDGLATVRGALSVKLN